MNKEIKIDLGDGDSAVMLTEMLHGTQRRIEEITRPFMKYPTTKMKVEDDKLVQAEMKSTEVEVDWSKADLTAIDDACILGQVKSWWINGLSLPVDQGVLDSLTEEKYKILKSKVDEVFSQVPLRKSGAKKSRKLFFWR